ncbi:Ribose-phosphate pyrophosphokinase 3 [Citrus sinensis]|nr:Ribose-phosphate pyrophosphokinase 3 [Citrus sinensis]
MKTPAAFISQKPPSPLFLKFTSNCNSKLLCANRSQTIQCGQIKSFENQPQKWSIDFKSGSEPIHLIQNSISTAATSASESASRTMKKVCLFYCPETHSLAERVAAQSDAIELRSINWSCAVRCIATDRKFKDGFPNLFIPNAHGIRGQHVAFLASFSSPGKIFEQLSVIYALPKLFVSSFTLVLPFFPTGTSERMEDEGDVATAFTLARILSNIPTSRGGPTSLVTFDIHALQERFYFGDTILPCFESAIPLLLNRLQQLPDSDNISIAFPDDGAWKRFHKQLQHFPMVFGDLWLRALGCKPSKVDGVRTVTCNKVNGLSKRMIYNKFTSDVVPSSCNDFNKSAWFTLRDYPLLLNIDLLVLRIVRIKEGDPRGRHIVIVDDLVQSGGTLIECQKPALWEPDRLMITQFVALVSCWMKVLAAHGAAKISAYVTHGIFPNASWERFEQDTGGKPESGLTYFWISDSCPVTVKEVMSKPPFEVLSLAGSIASALQI